MSLTALFFTQNRKNLLEKSAQKLPLVIAGNGMLQRTSDNTLPFSQDSNFWYLTGLDTPDAILVIDEDEEFLIVPGRSSVREAFDGAIDSQVMTKRSGITTVLHDSEGWHRLSKLVARKNQVSYLKPLPSYDARHGFYANPARRRTADKLRRLHPKLTVFDARAYLSSLRSIKQPIEIAQIERAVQITKDTLHEITSSEKFKDMQYEYELEAAITHGFRRRGASGHAYDPIVASGVNGTILHYGYNNAILKPTDYIVVDVGAEIEHYAADITRTLILGQASSRQRAVYDAVTRLQQQALALLKPGVLLREYEKTIEHLMGLELKQLRLITDETNHDAIRHYYPHGTSHFLGLDVHDVGDYHEPLAANMVVTCEPGIYIPEEGIGVRIEDDILITKAGNRVL